MQPLIHNPSWSKLALYSAAREYMGGVLALWKLPRPQFYPHPHRLGVNMRHGTGGMHFGLYLSAPFTGSVYVNVEASTVPVTSDRPRCYSYPGNKTDRTAAGILAHECGHHVWCRLVETQKHLIAVWNNLVLHVERKADKVSGYEPTPEEAFAESARVYALNPELLKRGSPRRFVFLYADLKLPLPHNVQWQTILAGAAPQIKRQVQNWCKI